MKPTAVRTYSEVHVKTYHHATVIFGTQISEDSYAERVSYIRCNHDHSSASEADDCAERLGRILLTGRTPKWARPLW